MGRTVDLEWNKRIGERIQAAREARELDRGAFSRLSGVGLGHLHAIETRGQGASLVVLRQITTALACDWETLLGPAQSSNGDKQRLSEYDLGRRAGLVDALSAVRDLMDNHTTKESPT